MEINKNHRHWLSLTSSRLRLSIAFGSIVLLLAVVLTLILYPFDYNAYKKPKHGIISTKSGIIFRAGPSIKAERLFILRKKSIVTILGETSREYDAGVDGKAKWFRLKTRSDHEGWGFSRYIKVIPNDRAEKLILKDKSDFELRLKTMIIAAAARRIKESGLFQYDRIADLHIVKPIEPTTSYSYNAYVDCFLFGNLIGLDKYRVSTVVNLEMDIDKNLLANSKVKVKHVDILGYRKIEGVEPGKVIDLLAKLL